MKALSQEAYKDAYFIEKLFKNVKDRLLREQGEHLQLEAYSQPNFIGGPYPYYNLYEITERKWLKFFTNYDRKRIMSVLYNEEQKEEQAEGPRSQNIQIKLKILIDVADESNLNLVKEELGKIPYFQNVYHSIFVGMKFDK